MRRLLFGAIVSRSADVRSKATKNEAFTFWRVTLLPLPTHNDANLPQRLESEAVADFEAQAALCWTRTRCGALSVLRLGGLNEIRGELSKLWCRRRLDEPLEQSDAGGVSRLFQVCEDISEDLDLSLLIPRGLARKQHIENGAGEDRVGGLKGFGGRYEEGVGGEL